MRRSRDFASLIDVEGSSSFDGSPNPHVAQRIRIGPYHSSPSQIYSDRVSNVAIGHLGHSRKHSDATTCIRGAMPLPEPGKIPRGQRQNFEREKLEKMEKQEIHKRVEHDRRDLIKHWTLFLEELLPSALKSDPEVRAKNGKPNLPKKVVYQLACKYICTEQGRQDDYEAMLRDQPSDQGSQCSEPTRGNAQVADDNGFDHVCNDFPKTFRAGSETPAITERDFVSSASSFRVSTQERGRWITGTTDNGCLLGMQPCTRQPMSTSTSTD